MRKNVYCVVVLISTFDNSTTFYLLINHNDIIFNFMSICPSEFEIKGTTRSSTYDPYGTRIFYRKYM
jgi:hypothetical protein